VYSPDNRFAFVADVGLDRIFVYRLDAATGAVSPHNPPYFSGQPGRGPRHLAIRQDGKFLYANNETASSVTAFSATNGVLKELQTVTSLPADFRGRNSTAEIQIDPAGKSTQGKTPRNFSLDPTGSYLFAANQNSGTIVLFRVERATGRLTPTGESFEVPTPSCVLFVKAD
jgi:6-phosphogluconolactonase